MDDEGDEHVIGHCKKQNKKTVKFLSEVCQC